jgi:hypothetical protein
VTGWLKDRTAIVGIGQTEFSKESGRTELQLACEAVKAALDDAGLAPADVDGLITFTMDSSEEMEVARNLGIPSLSVFTRVPYGGGRHRDAGGACHGDWRCRRRRVLPRLQRALGHAVR